MSSHLDLFTQVVHSGIEKDDKTGAIITPIYQTSTFRQEEPGVTTGYDYSRSNNPTRAALEKCLAAIEGATHALSFSSGLAAEQAIIQLLSPGERVVVCDDTYGGTRRLFSSFYKKYGIDFDFIDMTDHKAVEDAFLDPVHMVWIESPSNPTLKIVDLEFLAKKTKAAKAISVVDNTFASSIFQQPLTYGIHIVVHSSTKYLGGHSDFIGGALMTSDLGLYEKLKFIQMAVGSIPSPFECFLLLRSIKTLGLRMLQHEKNAKAVASFLENHRKVKKIYYPGLSKHPNHKIAKKQMKGFSGVVSFELDGSYKDLICFLKKLNIFIIAESLGGVESLVCHPKTMTHASVPESVRKNLGISDMLLRLSVGIEEEKDLIEDLKQALL